MNFFKTILCLGVMMSSIAVAGEAEVNQGLQKAMPGLQVSSVELSEMPGIYRVVTMSGEVLFVNGDASHFLTGDMYALKPGGIVNISESRREAARVEQVASVKADERIVFPAKGKTKARIAVFTDIECGYCRKLHREIPELNEMGIEVSYLAYPRAGVGSGAYAKYVSAWCADDKLDAMTKAKRGEIIPALNCENPVAAQYRLGKSIGISGTPAIVLEDGRLIPGYLEANKLASTLGLM